MEYPPDRQRILNRLHLSEVKVLQIKQLLPSDGTIGYGRLGRPSTNGTTIATIPAAMLTESTAIWAKGKSAFA